MNPTEPDKRQKLLKRLDEIRRSVERSKHALAFMGLGSTGQERHRLDEYSDLDFFLIVEDGHQNQFIDNLNWLSDICPLAFFYRNSVHGYKILFEDGIFIEFAVFNLGEIEDIPYASARVIWSADPVVAASIAKGNMQPQKSQPEIEWLVGEALTNLYVGLGRYCRGEKLNAARLIQVYALDRLIELSAFIEPANQEDQDPFANDRRIEQRYPFLAPDLAFIFAGYDHIVESGLAILRFLDRHFEVDEAMRQAILSLAAEDDGPQMNTQSKIGK